MYKNNYDTIYRVEKYYFKKIMADLCRERDDLVERPRKSSKRK